MFVVLLIQSSEFKVQSQELSNSIHTNYYIPNTKKMEKLTQKEEEVMQVIWKLEKAFVKEIVPHLEGTNHYNTISTVVRKLEEKAYVGYEAFGKTHRYFALVTKELYRSTFVSNAMTSYFNDSYKNMVSFFAKEEKITAAELREILNTLETKELKK